MDEARMDEARMNEVRREGHGLRIAAQAGLVAEAREHARRLGREGLRHEGSKDANGWSGAAYAARDGYAEVLRALLEEGLDPNERFGEAGMTLGHLAARNGSLACLEVLLSFGWDASAADRGGLTAESYAKMASGGKGEPCVRFLAEERVSREEKAEMEGRIGRAGGAPRRGL